MSQDHHISIGPTGFFNGKSCSVKVLRGHTQFHIEVTIEEVKSTNFGDALLQQIELLRELPWGKARDKPLIELIYQHCLPLIERLAPHTSLRDLSLETFLHSPTYNLELVNGGIDKNVRIEGEDKCTYTPAFFTAPIRTSDLPGLCKAVPHFQARELCVAPATEEGKSLDAIQGRVVTKEGGVLYFKPRVEMREPEFERELRVLSCIDGAGLATQLKVPKLQGIVVSEGGMAIGLLMTLITPSKMGTQLRSSGLRGRIELHSKWERQIAGIVAELHRHGIVWGDVHPVNIFIDEAMDAWAIDFGGMNNIEFVDDEKRETVEGDWQGVTRLFRDWLPNVQRQS